MFEGHTPLCDVLCSVTLSGAEQRSGDSCHESAPEVFSYVIPKLGNKEHKIEYWWKASNV